MEGSPARKPIRKQVEVEAETKRDFEEMGQKPEEIVNMFPPEKVLDPRVSRRVIEELGTEGYSTGQCTSYRLYWSPYFTFSPNTGY